MNAYVVKRGSEDSERFDPVKLHNSIFASCMSVRAFEGEAHMTAEQVCKGVINWLAEKAEVSTADIRRIAAEHLGVYHPEAAYMYEQYRLIL